MPAFLAIPEAQGTPIYMLEEWITGEFVKYMCNDGKATVLTETSYSGKTCMALAHWSLPFSYYSFTRYTITNQLQFLNYIINCGS